MDNWHLTHYTTDRSHTMTHRKRRENSTDDEDKPYIGNRDHGERPGKHYTSYWDNITWSDFALAVISFSIFSAWMQPGVPSTSLERQILIVNLGILFVLVARTISIARRTWYERHLHYFLEQNEEKLGRLRRENSEDE